MNVFSMSLNQTKSGRYWHSWQLKPVGHTGGQPRAIQVAAATAANTASDPFTGSPRPG